MRANNPKLIMHMTLKPWGGHMKFPTTIKPTSSLASDMPRKGKQLVVYPYKTRWKALSITHNYTSCIPQQVKTLMLWQKWEIWII